MAVYLSRAQHRSEVVAGWTTEGFMAGIDADSSGNVTVQEFMVFMRAHAAHLDSAWRGIRTGCTN